MAPIRIASENHSVVDSKAYLVAFKTFISIIFHANYSTAFLLFILCSRWSKMIGKEFRELKELRSESEILLSNQAIKSTTPGVAYM